MQYSFRKMSAIALISFMVLQMSGCGYFMYPERRGNHRGGEIDVKVAILDGLGLLFGIIPGVVAYAVDFTSGAIYLPAGKRNVVINEAQGVRTVYVSPEQLKNPEVVKSIVAKEMELPTTVDWGKLETSQIKSEQLGDRLTTASATGYAK
jgi:hypothetical protein